MKALHMVAFVLVVVGALNWGLVGLNPSWNVVGMVLGGTPALLQVVYVLVGLSGLYLAATHMNECKVCTSKKK